MTNLVLGLLLAASQSVVVEAIDLNEDFSFETDQYLLNLTVSKATPDEFWNSYSIEFEIRNKSPYLITVDWSKLYLVDDHGLSVFPGLTQHVVLDRAKDRIDRSREAISEVRSSLDLATEEFYLTIGMDVATIGYPMGNLPLTALGKLNQASPFLRHGIVSSLFPCPTPQPHGFTMDIMQQGGSSGSPILRVDDGVVVGMISSGVLEWKIARSQQASLAYSLDTNISIAEP